MPTTNHPKTAIVVKISQSPKVAGVAKPLTEGIIGSPFVTGAEINSNKTPTDNEV